MADTKKIFLDTDMGSDCDDVGAIAMLHNLSKQGKAEILGITHCGSEISGYVGLLMLNEVYGRKDISVGKYTKSVFLEDEKCKKYTKFFMERYLKEHEMPKVHDSVRVMRKALAENQNGDVTLITIGMLNNVAELLKSSADDISPLSGAELVKRSVKEAYVMGGHFTDPQYSEYNILTDAESAIYFADNFPVPVTYCGFEAGCEVFSGLNIIDDTDDNPLSLAYHKHIGYDNKRGALSWDPITVFAAILPDSGLLKKSGAVTVRFDERARTIVTDGGKDHYLIPTAPNDIIGHAIDEYITKSKMSPASQGGGDHLTFFGGDTIHHRNVE